MKAPLDSICLLGMCLMLEGVAAAQQGGSCWLRDATSPAKSLVYLLCEQGGVYITTDAGATWSMRNMKVPGHLRNVDFIDATRGFAVGDDGLLVATSDGGNKWEVRKTGVTQNLSSVQFIGQSGWAAGYDGVIIHSTDGGTTWSVQETNTKESLESVFFLDPDHGWAVGWAGTIMLTGDGGKTWKLIRTEAASWSLRSVYFRDVQNGWAVGFGGQILRSRDGGVTWTALKSPIQSWLTSIAFDKSNRGWITSDDSLLVSEDGGDTWRRIDVEDRLFLAQLIRVNDSLWAVGQLGVLRQVDGVNWKRIENLVTDDPTVDTPSTPTTSATAREN